MKDSHASARMVGLDNARGIAIFCVAILHAYGYQQVQAPNDLFLVFMHFVSQICVTTFFFVDGIVLYRAKEQGHLPQYATYIQRSAVQLLIPYLSFSFGYLLLNYIYELASGEASGLFPITGVAHLSELVWLSLISTQLYFLPALFLLRLFMFPLLPFLSKAPLLLFIGSLGTMAIYQFGILPVFQMVHSGAGNDPLLTSFFAIPFFLAGIGLYRSQALQSDISRLQFAVTATCIFLLMAITPFVLDTFGSRVQQLALVVALVLAVNSSATVTLPLSYLGKRSLVIFLLHMPVGIKIGQAFSSLINLQNDFIDVLFVSSISVLCALVFTSILNVLMLSKLAFGKKVPVFQ